MSWYLEEVGSGRKILLIQGTTAVGRTQNCAIKLESSYCSRNHCNFEVDETGVVRVVDFSTNGTFVNGECYGNMNVVLSEGDKIGIGWWPFENVVDTNGNAALYYLRRERPQIPTETAVGTPVIHISDTPVETVVETARSLPKESCQEVICISDDEEDRINLDKYTINRLSNGAEEPENHPALSAKVEVDEPPQFLQPVTSVDHPKSRAQTTSEFFEINSNAKVEFLPSATSSKILLASKEISNGIKDKNQIKNLTPLEEQSCNEEEDMDIDAILSQSILLEIKQEIAEYETEQSFDWKPDANALSGAQSKENVASTSHIELETVGDSVSPIFVIDSDDEAEDEDDATFSKWACKLSQSFVSSQSSTIVPEVCAESKKRRRSLSSEDIASKSTDNNAEEEKRIGSTKSSMLITPNSYGFQEKQASTSVKEKALTNLETDKPQSQATGSVDLKEVKSDLKHKLELIKPTPSTSRQAQKGNDECIYLQPKRKKSEVIDAPCLPTGRGKLREDISSNSTDNSAEEEEEKRIGSTSFMAPEDSYGFQEKKASSTLKEKALTTLETDKPQCQAISSVDSKEVKCDLKHNLELMKPTPSTSRQVQTGNNESIYLQPKWKKLEVIEAPCLPTGRGKLRGRSASATATASNLELKLKAVRQKERLNDQETTLQNKWHQKPAPQRHEQQRRKRDIQEERKVKLRELADKQTQKRKLDSDEHKAVTKPKVKVTDRNRGAYLAEDREAAKQRVLSQKIPKLSSKPSINSTAEKPSTSVCKEVPKVDEKPRRRSSTRLEGAKSSSLESKSSSLESKSSSLESKSSSLESKSSSLESKKTPIQKSPELKSILKTPGTSLKRKTRRSVRFSETAEVHFFNIDASNHIGRKVDCKDAPIDISSFRIMEQAQKRAQDAIPWVDNSDIILSDILSWDPKWLDNQNPEVNGPNHVLMPMMQQYGSLEDFSRIVLPLFKIELWHSIDQDYKRRIRDEFLMFQVSQFFIDKRGKNSRYVFHCEANARQIKAKMDITSYQICIVKLENDSAAFHVFGIIISVKCLAMKSSQEMISLQLEFLANVTYKQIFERARHIRIKPISNIRVEVGIYNAITNIHVSPLGKCILNPFELVRIEDAPPKKIRYKGYNEMNANQLSILLEAYQKCIDTGKSNNLFMINGPPGTGKSRLITNLALQILYGDEVRTQARKKRILICAQSNAAVDIIARKLLEIRGKMDRDKYNLVRFGVYERIHEGVRCISLHSLVQSRYRDKQTEADRNILRQERKLLESQIDKLKLSAEPNNVSRDELQKKKDRLAMINQLLGMNLSMAGQEAHFPRFLAGAHIVCTTLSSCIKLLNYTKKFDVCIIDEATQSTEPYTLIPFQFGISSLVLVGDTQQLPATVLSTVSEKYGFGTSLFTRIEKCLEGNKNSPIQTLKTQYRMDPEICEWSNFYFYKNVLINHESTQGARVFKPYTVFNLVYCQNFEEEKGKFINKLEAEFIVLLVSQLTQVMSPEYFSYGIITPYSHHKDYLQKIINEAGIKRVLVNTIDSYQGQEKDVVILSCVRTRGVGFLSNCQRLNVALTRAKKCLLVCGNFSSLMREPVWKSLIENAKRRSLYHDIKKKDAENFENKVMCHLKTIQLPALTKT